MRRGDQKKVCSPHLRRRNKPQASALKLGAESWALWRQKVTERTLAQAQLEGGGPNQS